MYVCVGMVCLCDSVCDGCVCLGGVTVFVTLCVSVNECAPVLPALSFPQILPHAP